VRDVSFGEYELASGMACKRWRSFGRPHGPLRATPLLEDEGDGPTSPPRDEHGIQLKTFADEAAARAWLRTRGVAA
jgi:hypothetical protein